MDNVTKKQALAKLDKLSHDIAYPDWIDDNDYLNEKYHVFNVSDNYVDNLFNLQMYRLVKMGQVSPDYQKL